MTNYKKINFFFIITFILFFISQVPAYSEWITKKKSETSKELLKVDDMYSKGYLTKYECTKMKAKLLKKDNAYGMCDDVVVVVKNNEDLPKSFDWMAEVRHPKTSKIFKATRLSTKKKAINLAIKKCYKFVTSTLNKKGYGDCYVSRAINTKDNQSEEIVKVSNDDGKFGSWTAIVEHKAKKMIYESSVKALKQRAIDDALSKCLFDWRHKEGDWPHENCILLSVSEKNQEKKSSYITKKSKKDKDKEKDLSKKFITKKEKNTRHYKKIKDLPMGQYYFVGFGSDDLKIIGYVNSDPKSKKIKVNNRNINKTSIGYAYVNDKKTICDVVSEIDESIGNNIYRGSAILNCKNKGKFFGGWVQQNNKGQGIGIDDFGNQLQFYFVSNKAEAFKLKDPYIDFAKKEPSIVEEEFKPKKGVVNKEPIIEIDLEQKIKPGSFKLAGKVKDNEQKDPPYLYIEDEEVKVNKDGSFNFAMFALNDTQITILAVDRRGKQKEVVVNVKVEKEVLTVEKLQKLNPEKIKTRKKNDRIAVIIGIENYKTIQKAAYANSDAEYFTEYAKRAFGIESKNIKTLIDDKADYLSTKIALFKWLKQNINKNKTEVIIFYSGHGLATLDTQELYLMMNNTDADFIEDSALSRNSVIERIASFEPKSVTMFIDACYNGETRDSKDTELLIASAKPLLKIEDDTDKKFPNNFTLFSSSQNSQASFSTKKETGVQYGIFSYYLMKGLEGNADLNKDRKITNGELHAYLTMNIPKIALSLHNREQDPFFKGNRNQILVKF